MYVVISLDNLHLLLASEMKQDYLADKFKNRILVGIKLSQDLVVLLLALIKLRLPRL